MNEVGNQLLAQLQKLPHLSFTVRGRLDNNRYLPRDFPKEYPLLIQLHQYPGYQHDVGETWLHWHDYYELVLMVSGSGVYHCGDKRFHFKAGDVIAVPPLKLHGVWRVKSPHTALCCFFHRAAIAVHETAVDQAFVSCFHQTDKSSAFHVLAEEVSSNLYEAFGELILPALCEEDAITDWCGTKMMLLQLLYHLRTHFLSALSQRQQTPYGDSAEPVIREVLDYIAKRATDKLSQTEVAKVAGMSVSRFRNFFKETTGWRYSHYLLNVRLELAAQKLRDSSESVAAIAHAVGFADQSHLQRAFKAHYHVSPLAYRKEHSPSEKYKKRIE
jgi:AraC family transcriptional activator of mtrCDE